MDEWDKLQVKVIIASRILSDDFLEGKTPAYYKKKEDFELAVCALADLIRDVRDP
jgi:hypothetical protein